MRILIINPYYYPTMIGGTESVIKLLSEEFVREGEFVAVYTADSDNIDLKKEIINGVVIYRGVKAKFHLKADDGGENPLNVKIKNNLMHRQNIWIKKELEYVLHDYQPDVVHTQNLYGFSTHIWKLIGQFGIPIVHTAHDYWLLKPEFRFWLKRNVDYITALTAPSKATLDQFENIGCFNKCLKMVIPNAINQNSAEFNTSVSKQLSKRDEIIRFLYVGQLIEKKGIPQLLEAFGETNRSNTELHICGDGSLRETVEHYAKKDNRIVYHGFLSSDDLGKVYDICDVLIVPSIWDEPFGMVAIEAFYHGMTVIAANRGGLREIVETIECGLVVEPSCTGIRQGIETYCDRDRINYDVARIERKIGIYSLTTQAQTYKNLYCDVNINRRS